MTSNTKGSTAIISEMASLRFSLRLEMPNYRRQANSGCLSHATWKALLDPKHLGKGRQFGDGKLEPASKTQVQATTLSEIPKKRCNSPVPVFNPGTTSLILSCIELGPSAQAELRSSSMW